MHLASTLTRRLASLGLPSTGGYDFDGGLLYDGHEFVNTTGQTIVVINYRLGALGFLYAGGASKGTTIEGNYGLQDQIMAMSWVQANIAPFGGDPSRITLIGQSAGAMSISAHLSRPETQGLYAGAIQHSNPFAEPYRGPDEALAVAAGFANYSGCGPNWIFEANWSALESCLRACDTATIVAAAAAAELDLLADLDAILQVVVAWGPTIRTPYLPLRPLEAFQQGLVNDVPIAIGTTANETVRVVPFLAGVGARRAGRRAAGGADAVRGDTHAITAPRHVVAGTQVKAATTLYHTPSMTARPPPL